MANKIEKNGMAEKNEQRIMEALGMLGSTTKGMLEHMLDAKLDKELISLQEKKLVLEYDSAKTLKTGEKDYKLTGKGEEIYQNSKAKPVIPDLRELKIKSALSKEKPIFQSIGIGLNDEILYFGTKYFEEGQSYDAVITSDRKIYVAWKDKNEIKEVFKLNYRYQLYDDVIDYMWSNTGKYGISAWLFGDLRKITFKEMFEDVLKLFKWKYWNPEEKVYKHHALSLISNYFLPIFEMKGRELVYGQSGFGKTRLSKIYQLLTFNPAMSMDFTDSPIFRIIESTKATIIIDNFDSANEEKRKKIEHLFNTGCYQKQKAVRSEGKSFRPTGFNIFSNMVLNSITNLDEVSENRSNITTTFKTDKPEFTKLEDNNPIWSEKRDKLHVFALQNYKEVSKSYSELKEDKIVSRELERVAPILTIAKLISSGLYDEMIKFYIDENERRKSVKDLKEDWIYLAVEKVIDKMKMEDVSEIEFRIGDIVNELASQLFSMTDKFYDTKKHKLAIHIGCAFRILFPVRRIQGYSNYTVNKVSLIQFCKAKDFGDDIIKSINQLKDSTNTTNTTNSTDSTNSTNKEGECVESGESVGQKPTNNLDEDEKNE